MNPLIAADVLHNVTIRLGDLAQIFIFANYLKVIHKYDLTFLSTKFIESYIKETSHYKIISKNIITSYYDFENLYLKKSNINIKPCDSIPLYFSIPQVVLKYGTQIIPYLNMDPELYTGPEIESNDLICFNPLFDAAYNKQRIMSDSFCNKLIDILYLKYGSRLIIITDKPDRINNVKVAKYVTPSIYNILFLISKCKIFIGGDTGFTHFAGLLRPRVLISIYGDNLTCFFNRRHPDNRLFHWSSNPITDLSVTQHLHLIMQSNSLHNYCITQIINLIDLYNTDSRYL